MKRIAAFGGAYLFTIALLPSSTFANQGGGWGGNYPPPPPPPPSDYQHYQGGPPPPQQGQRGGPPPSQPGGPRYPPQQMGGPPSEDQHGGWGGPPGQGGGGGQGRGPPPPSGYGYGARPLPPQQQQQQQQQDGGGFWTRLTNKIFAGGENDYPGSSQGGLGGEFSGWGGPSNQQSPPPALPPGPSHHQHQHHRPSQFAGGPPQSPFPAQQQEPGRSISTRPPWDRSAQGQQEQQQQQGPGFWGRISSKIVTTTQNLLESKPDNGQQQGGGPGQQQGGYPGRGGPYGASPYGGHPQHQQPPMRGGPPKGRPQGGPTFGGGPPPPPPPGLQHQQHQPQLHQQHQQGHFPPFEGAGGPVMMGGNHFLDQVGQQQAPPEDETETLPDIFTVGDNIVLVPNPKAMRIKIENFARAGVQNLEVLAAFDGAMKAYRTPDRKRKTESTETLVHNAVLLPASRSKIAAITEKFDREYESASSPEARYENREALKREVQLIVVSDGQIYLNALPRAVHDFLGTVPLRPHMDQFLKPLAFHGIPLTLFCTGYGEVLTQILALSNPSLCTPEGYLPPNVRIVSNFFRTGADGIAMGFTDPIVHELNRNLTTARHFRSGMMMGLGGMNMPPRGPPQNLLVIGGSLADLDMAAGLTSRERPPPSHQLSVGFIATNEKFLAELPKYLEHYDAIILGDGGLQYANHVIEQIVG